MDKVGNKVSALVLMAGLMAGSLTFATPYKLDASHSEVGFQVTHMMISKVKGRFLKFEGAFDFDEKKGDVKGLEVKIAVDSITTDNGDRDKHLKSPDFFDAGKFPEITFKGDKVELKDGKPVKIAGTLTIHGKAKPVTLDVEYRGAATDPYGNEKIGFSATTKIDRKDFDVKWNKTMDKGGLAVSDDVMITIDGEATKVKADAKAKK